MLNRFGSWMAEPPTKREFVVGAVLLVLILAAELAFIPVQHP